MTLEGVSFWTFYSINDLKSAFGKLSPNKKIVSFQQILKVGENIKIDICKCPINVELVKKKLKQTWTFANAVSNSFASLWSVGLDIIY